MPGLVLPPGFEALEVPVRLVTPADCDGAMRWHGRYMALGGLAAPEGSEILAVSQALVFRLPPREELGSADANRVRDIEFGDEVRSIWVATGDGIYCFDRVSGNYTAFHTVDGVELAYGHLVTNSLAWDANGNLWASFPYGIACFDGVDWFQWDHETLGVNWDITVIDFSPGDEFRSEELWVGAWWDSVDPYFHPAGVYVGSPADLRFLNFFDGAWPAVLDGVWGIYFDNEGLAWIERRYKMVVSDGYNVAFPTDARGEQMPTDRVFEMAQAPDGRRFFGSDIGLIVFDGFEWELITEANSGLPCDRVEHLAFDSDGVLWLLTGDGNLASYDRDSEWTIWGHGPGAGTGVFATFLLKIDCCDTKWLCQGNNNGVISFDGVNWRRYRVGLPQDDEDEGEFAPPAIR